MNENDKTPAFGQPSTAEEDIALQTIESLDVAGSNETPVEPTTSAESGKDASATNVEPISTDRSPMNDIKPAPHANDKLAAANAEPATPTQSFQPFAKQKKAHNPLKIVLVIFLVLILLGAVGYFGWQYYQSTLTAGSSETTQSQPSQDATTASDTEAAVNQDISELEALVQSMSDEELSDDTISDTALYN